MATRDSRPPVRSPNAPTQAQQGLAGNARGLSASTSRTGDTSPRFARGGKNELTVVDGQDFRLRLTQDFHSSRSGDNDFHTSKNVELDPKLISAMDIFFNEIIERGWVEGRIVRGQGVRQSATAHRWSTAYHICHYMKPFVAHRRSKATEAVHLARRKQILDNLRALDDGCDTGGHRWYGRRTEAEWSASKLIQANSEFLKKERVGGVAAEGYDRECVRRLPNIREIGVSNHLHGNAMDVRIPWKPGRGETLRRNADGVEIRGGDLEVNRLIARLGLWRPIEKEPWHFELFRGFDFYGDDISFEADLTLDEFLIK